MPVRLSRMILGFVALLAVPVFALPDEPPSLDANAPSSLAASEPPSADALAEPDVQDDPGFGLRLTADLDVTYIARLPRDCHMYIVDYPNGVPVLRAGTANQKRWPAFNEVVTFEAHVINKGSGASTSVNCRWLVNGAVIGTGTIPALNAGQETTTTVNWAWNVSGIDRDHTNQTVTCEVDYDHLLAEDYEQNNTLTDYLEGCSLAIFVEQPIYDAFNGLVNLAGTRSFEDWIQAEIKAMNANFARSTYPLAASGCLERVRIDKIVVGPLPANDGLADGRWQFTGDPAYASWAANLVDGGLIHELMHQLGIIDLYQLPVSPAHNMVVTPDGLPCGMGYGFGRPGIMAGGDIAPHSSGSSQTMPEYCSSHDVLGLNSNCGYKRGYYGEYMYDIPQNNYVRVLDSAGHPAANVAIKVYQGGGGAMAAAPVATGTTDANGVCQLPNRAPASTTTTATGHTLRANPFGTVNVVGQNGTLLIEMSRGADDFDYRFMSIIQFNLAFWGGQTATWTYDINSRLAANTLPRITDLNAAVESTSVKLVWSAAAGATSYRIYRASSFLNRPEDPQHVYENWVFKPLTTTAATTYTDSSRFETSRYAVAPIAADGTEGQLSNRVFAPNLLNPWGIGILPDNQRVILDPQNGFAYLRQTSDGVFVANTGSEHDHVEYSHFLAIDARLNRMLTAHPTDYYGGPHSIRVTNYNGDLDNLQDYGTLGSGNGQFNNPCGVAVDGSSRIYAVDNGNSRIQILSSSGGFLVAFGSPGTGNGQFQDPQGIAVTPDYKIYVCDRGNRRVQTLQYTLASNTVQYVGLLTGRTLRRPTGVARARDGRLFVTDSELNTVEEFSALGQWRHTYLTALAPYSGTLSGPTGIAVDGAGRVVVCDTNKRRVVVVYIAGAPGDLNCDGVINFDDVNPFVMALVGQTGYEAHYANCRWLNADINADGTVDFDDINPFVACLVAGGCP